MLPAGWSRRATALSAIILVQALCAAFFIGDVLADLRASGVSGWHLDLEALAALSLAGGVVLLMIELRAMLGRVAAMETGLSAARGDMARVIGAFFDRWGLTPSEREVAMLILKGFDNAAIAQLRGLAPGTIRAQTARIYAKSGTDGRAQLFSVFMEELLAGPEG